jgi:hypothetical protein
MDDLLMGVFLAYIRAFASLQYRGESPQIKLDFERPSVAKFIHELYKHGARSAWKSAFLFKTHGTTSEQQARNRRDIEILLDKCLADVINAFIPWKEISRAYFQAPKETEPPVKEAEPTPSPPKPSVKFAEESEEEDDDDESHNGDRPAISLGEDLKDVDLGIEEEKDETQEVEIGETDASDTLVLKL